MKKLTIAAIFALALTAGSAWADNSLTAYGTYWDADNSGKGAGLRYKKAFLGFGAVDGRAGYVDFNSIETEMVPLELSINARLPFMISPYVGVGGGYYLLDSKLGAVDNSSGYFAQLGVEATFLWIGAMAEVRWHDLEENYFDGTSFNAGLLIKW